MSKPSRLERLLKPTRSGATRLCDEETERYRLAWRKRFAARLDPELSGEGKGGFDWHAFSYQTCRHVTGDEARNAYRNLADSADLVLLPHRGEGPGFRAHGAHDFSGAGVDVYIFPEDLSWTMVFTHEDGWLGPYFSKAAWVDPPSAPGPSTSGRGRNRK
ncbi:MAG: DUF4275 family protein [Polyangiaceae bacterium]